MAKKPKLNMPEVDPALVPEGECPHCFTDGQRDHSKRCPTLAGMTDE